ncbi:MAG: BatD family protein [Candidatus Omnitrophica bacterium]|nr:BatD family protein [Candidatus Omnitrophota bacterium]
MRLRKIINLICVIFCLGISLVSGDFSFAAGAKEKKNLLEVEATATVDKTSIQIGDKFNYTITVKAKKNIEVEFPQILPENLSGFAIKDFGSSQKWFFGRETFKQWYILDTYVSGKHTIPAVIVKYRPKGQANWQEVAVDEIKLEIKSVLDNTPNRTADIRDIKGPKSFASRMPVYIISTLALLLIGGGIFALILWKKKKVELKALSIPAHIIAYEALAELEKKDYIHKPRTIT